MTGVDERVAIRRKSDGKWLRNGGGPFAFFWVKASPIKARAVARVMLRIDFGFDEKDFEILPWAEVPDEVKS